MSRLGLVWRLALIVIAAVVVIQIVAIGAYYAQRDRVTEAGYQPPLPDQIVALATLLDTAPNDQRALMLRAINGIAFTAAVVPDASAGAEGRRPCRRSRRASPSACRHRGASFRCVSSPSRSRAPSRSVPCAGWRAGACASSSGSPRGTIWWSRPRAH